MAFRNIVDKRKYWKKGWNCRLSASGRLPVLHPDLQIRDGLLLVFRHGVSILVLSYQSDTGGKGQKSNRALCYSGSVTGYQSLYVCTQLAGNPFISYDNNPVSFI